MSNYSVIDKDGNRKPVHNLMTGIYLVESGEARMLIDDVSNREIRVEKKESNE
jgi:hypothetical protein